MPTHPPPQSSSILIKRQRRRAGGVFFRKKTLSRIGFVIFLIVFINIQIWIYLDNDGVVSSSSSSSSSLNTFTTTTTTNAIPKQQQQEQQPIYKYPVFVVGMPKSGTTSIYNFFHCNGIKSSHYCCCGSNRTHTHCNDNILEGGKTCAECIRNNIKNNLSALEKCGDYKVYAQLDAELGKSIYLPQRFHLDKLHKYAPDATFILNVRPTEDWLRSVTNWFGLGGRFLTRFNVNINDPNIDRNQALLEIFNNHSDFIRNFTRYHPTHNLLEVDITQQQTGTVLANAFGLHESCWGKHNVNKKVGVKWN